VCVCYATLGIPLYLISLAKVSFLVADMFRYLYRRVFCSICINAWEAHRHKTLRETTTIQNAAENDDPNIVTTSNNRLTSVNNISGSATQLSTTSTASSNKPIVVADDSDDLDDDQDSSKVKVPLIIVIALGSYIFTVLEGYTFTQGIYYCYVSLATIGRSQ
jgi:hypothetical protein